MRLNNDEASGRRCIKQLGDIQGPFPAEAYFYSNTASGSKAKVSLSTISTAALRLIYTLHVSLVEWMLQLYTTRGRCSDPEEDEDESKVSMTAITNAVSLKEDGTMYWYILRKRQGH